MRVNLRLSESEDEISKRILNALRKEVDKVLKKASKNMASRIQLAFLTSIQLQPEYLSLTNPDGQLRIEIGLPDAETRLQNIINTWVNSITVDISKTIVSKDKLKASLEVSMVRQDWSDVLNIVDSVLVTEKGVQLEWLKWLLTEGDTAIFREYEVMIGHFPNSRTNKAVMVKKTSGLWRIPPQFAGTTDNNFVTRAIDPLEDAVKQIILEEISKAIS